MTRTRRLRFSILNLLLAMAIVALGVSLYLSQQKLQRANLELRELRSLAGHLTIDDPTKVQVIAVPMAEKHRYRFHIYLPAAHNYELFTYKGKLTAERLPERSRAVTKGRLLQSRGQDERSLLLDVVLQPNLDDSGYVFRISEDGWQHNGIYFDAGKPTWAGGGAKMMGEAVYCRGHQMIVDADKPAKLLLLDGQLAGGENVDDAVLIWIGPEAKSVEEAAANLGDRW